MTRRLHLLRHAKSSWDDAGQPDHERPLAPRGIRAGGLLAGWIAGHGPRPELVLCSTAVRARATLALVAEALGDPPVRYEEGLYHAGADRLAARVADLDDDLVDVLLVGHNPGLQQLALAVAAASPERDAIAAKLPTGALVTVEGEGSWRGLCGRVVSLVLPRSLG